MIQGFLNKTSTKDLLARKCPIIEFFGCQIYFIFIEILDWSFNLQNEESMGQEEEKRRADLRSGHENVSTSFE